MNSIDVLMEEHEEITEMLNILDRINGNIRSGIRVNPEHTRRALEFIRLYAERRHYGKEDILHSKMEEKSI